MPSEKQNKPDQKITLTIVSTSGDLEDSYNVHMKVGAVKVSAMAKLKIDPSMAKNYELIYEGNTLPEDKTLAELAIPDGAVLKLEPEPEVI